MEEPKQSPPARVETCACGHHRYTHDTAGSGACHGDAGLERCACASFTSAPEPELRRAG